MLAPLCSSEYRNVPSASSSSAGRTDGVPNGSVGAGPGEWRAVDDPCPVAAAADLWVELVRQALGCDAALVSMSDGIGRHSRSTRGLDDAGLASVTDAELIALLGPGEGPFLAEGEATPDVARRLGLASLAAAPVRAEDGRVVGVVCGGYRAPRAWNEAERRLLDGLAAALSREVGLHVSAAALERANTVIAAHNRIHELIRDDRPLKTIFVEAVRSIERFDPSLRGSLLMLDHEKGVLRTGAAPSLPLEYIEALDGLEPGPDVGTCGTAAYTGHVVITEDIARDPAWDDDGRAVALRCGLAACWSVPIVDNDGTVLGTFAVYSDRPARPTDEHLRFLRDAARLAGIAIERQRASEALAFRATHDSLTGLPNRSLLTDRLTQALARSRRRGTQVGVLAVDVDRMRLVNESLGHDAGDELLRELGCRLAGCVRPGDTVARFGGDEFLIVCDEVDDASLEELAVHLLEVVAQPTEDGLTPTCSIGGALVSGQEVDASEALRRAELALAEAKGDGGNRFHRGNGLDAIEPGRRLTLEAALRGALERGELHLAAQAVVPITDGQPAGFEALMRWTHPELGPIGPNEFIPIAEESGLIETLGLWALREAAAAGRRMQEGLGRPLDVAVNVSPRQLRDPEFPERVAEALEEVDLPAEQLVIEITETALLGPEPTIVRNLRSLRELGVRLALDDFGTGFSSLSMLKDHPIDIIKIDRSFVAGLPHDESSAAIVSAVIGMAHALGRTVTAEGIETAEQLAFLRALGCDQAQGYLYGKPEPLDSIDFVGVA